MLAQFLAVVLLAGTQQGEGRPPEMPVLQSRLGGTCSTEFLVTDETGAPVYNAIIHVRVRYGALGIKRADLEIGSDAAGKARIDGLPNKARPLMYDIQKDGRKTSVRQDVADMCEATFTVVLK